MYGIKMMKKNFQRILTKKPSRSIMTGLALGFLFGTCLMYFGKQNDEYWILFLGALLGVTFQVLYEVIDDLVKALRMLRPLREILGTISTENSWVYISAFRTDMSNSILYRNDHHPSKQTRIFGSEYVYGKGDAIALSYLFHIFEQAKIGKAVLTVQDSEHAHDSWGRSAICIGAHNPKTREIMTKFKSCRFRFHRNYTEITHDDFPQKTNSDGIKFYRAVRKKSVGDGMEIDYGVILKLKDEYHSDKDIIVVAGLGDMGTAGAAYFLYKNFDELPHRQNEFGILIEVPSGIESARKANFSEASKTYNSILEEEQQ
jgi:hypothetical protein